MCEIDQFVSALIVATPNPGAKIISEWHCYCMKFPKECFYFILTDALLTSRYKVRKNNYLFILAGGYILQVKADRISVIHSLPSRRTCCGGILFRNHGC